jgi:short-subunit dehydrogenase involved in D-alanine esterification of teichoic acids
LSQQIVALDNSVIVTGRKQSGLEGLCGATQRLNGCARSFRGSIAAIIAISVSV